MGSLHFHLGIPWALNRGTFGGRERTGASRILYDIPACPKTFLENTRPQSRCKTVAPHVLLHFKHLTGSLELQGSWKQVNKAETGSQQAHGGSAHGWVKSCQRSDGTDSLHCWHFSPNSVHSLRQILEKLFLMSRSSSSEQVPHRHGPSFSLKAPELGTKHCFDFPSHSSSSAIAEPEAALQTSLLLLLLPTWQHFTCSRET